MPLSIVDLYQKILPKTNCRECGFPTCLAFASMVVSEKFPLEKCPYIAPDKLKYAQEILNEQYAAGKWLKKDMAKESLQWAKERSASMNIADLPARIGGELIRQDSGIALKLPYFKEFVIIRKNMVSKENGEPLNQWEQVFIYNHMAQGGSVLPTGKWKGLQEFPNTVSKIKSMISHVESPLAERFAGKIGELKAISASIGGTDVTGQTGSADLAVLFTPLPMVPVMLMFWDRDTDVDIQAKVKLMFDETVTQHLDIESIMFLSERIKQMLLN